MSINISISTLGRNKTKFALAHREGSWMFFLWLPVSGSLCELSGEIGYTKKNLHRFPEKVQRHRSEEALQCHPAENCELGCRGHDVPLTTWGCRGRRHQPLPPGGIGSTTQLKEDRKTGFLGRQQKENLQNQWNVPLLFCLSLCLSVFLSVPLLIKSEAKRS